MTETKTVPIYTKSGSINLNELYIFQNFLCFNIKSWMHWGLWDLGRWQRWRHSLFILILCVHSVIPSLLNSRPGPTGVQRVHCNRILNVCSTPPCLVALQMHFNDEDLYLHPFKSDAPSVSASWSRCCLLGCVAVAGLSVTAPVLIYTKRSPLGLAKRTPCCFVLVLSISNLIFVWHFWQKKKPSKKDIVDMPWLDLCTDSSPAESLYIFISSVLFGRTPDCSLGKKDWKWQLPNIVVLFLLLFFWGQWVVIWILEVWKIHK